MGATIKDLFSYNSINSVNYGDSVVFFKIGADWCIPCNELEKVLNSIPNSIIYHISIDNMEFESFFMDNQVTSVPYTIIKYQNATTRFKGIRTKEQILELIDFLKMSVA